jgi:hypothetical protein
MGRSPPVQVVKIPKVGNRNLKQWLKNDKHVYIGRNLNKYVDTAKPEDDKWGNPFSLSTYSRGESLNKYEVYARNSAFKPKLHTFILFNT